MTETFVLVPGGWHGGWAWRPVARHLREAGHHALPVTLPGLNDGDDPTANTLADAVDHIVDVIERADLREVTLVGHSWGGYPISGVAARIPDRLRRLVFWNAFVPAAGRSFLDEIPSQLRAFLVGLAGDTGKIEVPYDLWRGLTPDMSEAVAEALFQLLLPHPLRYFDEAVTPPPPGFPVEYVFSAADTSMPAEGEYGWLRFPARLGVDPVSAPGAHEALLSDPAGLAEALLAATDGGRQRRNRDARAGSGSSARDEGHQR